jgi:ATP-binding cassette subfamily F protein 3
MTSPVPVLEFLEAEAPTALIPRLRDMLGAFLFRGDDVYKPLPVLSGGERSRIALLRMLLKPMNLLILDEPTNHLDLYSKDILLETLTKFSGTIIFVSHDRAFMEALSTKTLELSPRGPRLFYGDYGYYLDRLEREEAAPSGDGEGSKAVTGETLPDNAGPPGAADPAVEAALLRRAPERDTSLPKVVLLKAGSANTEGLPGNTPPRSGAERRSQEKQRQTLIRRLERQEEDILKALEELEAERAALEGELARPEVYSNGEKAREVKFKLDRTNGEIAARSREWEAKAGELEAARQD